MANWNLPSLTDTFQNVLQWLKDRDTDLALWFDGTTETNIPTGTKRWNSTNSTFELWNGTAWVALATKYNIDVDTVDGKHAGNAQYNLALNNGVLNAQLVSQYLGSSTQDASFFRNASNINAGTLPLGRLSGTYNISISGNAATANTAGDADTLDGQHGAYYLNASNINAGTLAEARLPITVPLRNAANIWVAPQTFNTYIMFEEGEHRFTYNDGAGNFNYRHGHYFDPSTGTFRYTKANTSAVFIQISHDQVDAQWSVRLAPRSTAADQAFLWSHSLVFRNYDGALLVDGNQVHHDGNLPSNDVARLSGSNFTVTPTVNGNDLFHAGEYAVGTLVYVANDITVPPGISGTIMFGREVYDDANSHNHTLESGNFVVPSWASYAEMTVHMMLHSDTDAERVSCFIYHVFGVNAKIVGETTFSMLPESVLVPRGLVKTPRIKVTPGDYLYAMVYAENGTTGAVIRGDISVENIGSPTYAEVRFYK